MEEACYSFGELAGISIWFIHSASSGETVLFYGLGRLINQSSLQNPIPWRVHDQGRNLISTVINERVPAPLILKWSNPLCQQCQRPRRLSRKCPIRNYPDPDFRQRSPWRSSPLHGRSLEQKVEDVEEAAEEEKRQYEEPGSQR
jgi:hypothetical protein